MTFTDEDLKRLKDLSNSEDSFRGAVSAVKLDILALLARLEAAEEVASYFANHPDGAHWWPYAQNALEAWRKSKGE